MNSILKVFFLTLLLISGSFVQAQNSTSDSVEVAIKSLGSDSLRAAFLNDLSVKHRNSDFARSLQYAGRARDIAQKAGIQSELGKAYVNIGVENYYRGDYKAALESYQEALRVYERSGDVKGEATVLNEVGTFNKRHGDTAQARINYEKAYHISKTINDSSQMANAMNNLGLIYELMNRDDMAMDYFLKSVAIKEAMNDLFGAAYNYDNIGGNMTKQKRYSEAAQWLQKSIDVRKKLNDQTGLALSINNMGEMYLQKGEPAHARVFFEEALAMTYQIHYVHLRAFILEMISECWKREQNYKKALEFYSQSILVKDSVFSERQRQEILNLQARYETERKEREIVFLKGDNELKDYKIRQNTIYIVGLVLLVPLLLLIGFFWRSRVRLLQQTELESTRAILRENQLEAVISSQEKERKRFAADLHDGLGQMISALRLSLSRENPQKSAVDHALNLLQEMNTEIRNIAFNLMPHVLVKGGLEEALNEFAGRVNRTGKIHISITSFGLTTELSDDLKIALYRICQEWVNNAIKYSNCTTITIELVQHPDELVIMIEDNGNGFDKNVLLLGEGNGWKNISSRLAMMKGTLEINSRPGYSGTTVAISTPLKTV